MKDSVRECWEISKEQNSETDNMPRGKVVTDAELRKALGWWMFVLDHYGGHTCHIELRLRRPWRILGKRFHQWVTFKVGHIVAGLMIDKIRQTPAGQLPAPVNLYIWR